MYDSSLFMYQVDGYTSHLSSIENFPFLSSGPQHEEDFSSYLEHLETISVFQDEISQSFQGQPHDNSNDYAVKLEQEEPEEPKKFEEHQSLEEEKELSETHSETPESLITSESKSAVSKKKQVLKIEDIPEDLSDTLEKLYSKLREKQHQIDQGTYTSKGPGRKRKNRALTSVELTKLIEDKIVESIREIMSNKRCKNRKDALITIYIRSLKKLTYFLMRKCAANNMYKRNKMSEFVTAFAESYFAFMASIKYENESSLIKNF